MVVVMMVSASPAEAQAGIEDCIAIGKAGASIVMRCEDPDTGVLCYANTIGMLFCLQ